MPDASPGRAGPRRPSHAVYRVLRDAAAAIESLAEELTQVPSAPDWAALTVATAKLLTGAGSIADATDGGPVRQATQVLIDELAASATSALPTFLGPADAAVGAGAAVSPGGVSPAATAVADELDRITQSLLLIEYARNDGEGAWALAVLLHAARLAVGLLELHAQAHGLTAPPVARAALDSLDRLQGPAAETSWGTAAASLPAAIGNPAAAGFSRGQIEPNSGTRNRAHRRTTERTAGDDAR